MIRRNVNTENQQPAWLLISQVEHARLSGELAEHWKLTPTDAMPSFIPLVSREELLPAIYHHDDGWLQWEESPEVDPQTGRPLAFTEMPLRVALDIWRHSIDKAVEIGPLAAWVVAGHFTALLSHSHEAKEPFAIAWLEEYDVHRHEWLQAWISSDPAAHTQNLAETGLRQLQLFDYLSLWLCMAERTTSQAFDTPGGCQLTLSPQAVGAVIQLSPWPLKVDHLELSVSGHLVPAQAYPSSSSLASKAYQTQKIAWRFVADSTL